MMLDGCIKGDRARVLIIVVFSISDNFRCFQMFRRFQSLAFLGL